VLLLFADFISFSIDQHSSIFVQLAKKYYFMPILNDAESFYKTYAEPLQTDEFVMLLWLWPERAYLARRAFETDPFYRIYSDEWRTQNFSFIRRADSYEEMEKLARIFGVDTVLYEIDERFESIMTDPTDDVVLKALYCDKTGYDDFDYELLYAFRDHEGGYGDTHYLLSLLFLEKLGCGDASMIAHDKQMVIDSILTAQRHKQEFSDLFAERIVLLYWAGRGDDVEIGWIIQVVKNIQKDGGWKDINRDKSDPHATGLSALAIKYFIANDENGQVLIK